MKSREAIKKDSELQAFNDLNNSKPKEEFIVTCSKEYADELEKALKEKIAKRKIANTKYI